MADIIVRSVNNNDSGYQSRKKLNDNDALLAKAVNQKADKSDIANILSGMINKGSVKNVSDLDNVENPQKGWAYVVINEKDENGNSYIYQFDGTRWNNTDLTAFPADVITQRKLTKTLGNSKTEAPSEYAITKYVRKYLSPVLQNEILADNGKYLFCLDGSIDVFDKHELSISEVNINEYIDADGYFIPTATVYYRSPKIPIPTGPTKVKIRSFNTETKARAIALYNNNGSAIYVPQNVGKEKEIIIDLPASATYYAVSRDSTSDDFICEFYTPSGTIENDNEISIIDKEGSSYTKTVLKSFSNLDVATGKTAPSKKKTYIAPKGVYPLFTNNKIPVSDSLFTISGYINRTNGLVYDNSSYSSTDFIELDNSFLSAEITVSHASASACDIIYYDKLKIIISANSQGEIRTGKPYGAKYIRYCKRNSLTGYFAYMYLFRKTYTLKDLTIAQYVRRDNGSFVDSPIGYLRSKKTKIDPSIDKSIYITISHNSAGACDIAFYDSSDSFISANAQGQTFIPVPSNAAYYIKCSKADLIDYCCSALQDNNLTQLNVDNLSLLTLSYGQWQAQELSERDHEVRENNLIKTIVSTPTQITADNVAYPYPSQISYEVYTTIEVCEVTASFRVKSSDFSVWIGKGDHGMIVMPTKVNISRWGTAINNRIDLPFTINNGDKVSLTIRKTRLYSSFVLVAPNGTFEKTYVKDGAEFDYQVAMLWGNPFIALGNGSIEVNSFTFSSGYKPDAVLSIFGDSFIEGATMRLDLSKRWCDMVANIVGYDRTVINGRGGRVLNDDFYKSFIIENAWFYTKYVVISLGVNNLDTSAKINDYLRLMPKIIQYLKDNNQIPVLVTVTPRIDNHPGLIDQASKGNVPSDPDWSTTGQVINDFVRNSGELYIDMHKALTASDKPDTLIYENIYINPKTGKIDGVHPSVLGHSLIFKRAQIDAPYLFQL